MSTPNLDSRYITPTQVDTKIANQATTDAGQYAPLSSASLSAKSYGALGNGTSDDTAALQNAIAAALSANSELYIPSGTYKVTAALSASAGMVRIRGAGAGTTILSFTSNAFNLLTIGNGSSGQIRATGYLKDLSVRGPSSAPTSGYAAVVVNGLNQFSVENVQTDNQDIGFDLINNCYGSQFSNIRAGFAGSVNVGVNLRTGSQSGSDLTFTNPWLAGQVAAMHCSPGGGGYHVFGGQLSVNGTTVANDNLGTITLGKDYLTGATGEGNIDLHGTSFEGSNYCWVIRSWDQAHIVMYGCSIDPADSTKPAIGVWKATTAKNSRAKFDGTGLSGYFSGSSLLSVAGTFSSAQITEVGTYTASQQPYINGVQTYVNSMTTQSSISTSMQPTYGTQEGRRLSPLVTGLWYCSPDVQWNGVRTITPTIGKIYLAGPAYARDQIVVSQLRVYVSTVASGSLVRVGIYTGMIGAITLLVDAGTIDTSGSTGYQSITLSSPVTIPSDTYFWLASVQQGSAASTVYMSGASGSGYGYSPLGGGYQTQSNTGLITTAATYTSGVNLPATYSGYNASTNDSGVEYYRSA